MTFEIVDALAYLNRQGLVHRNLSPTNILLSPEVATLTKHLLHYILPHKVLLVILEVLNLVGT